MNHGLLIDLERILRLQFKNNNGDIKTADIIWIIAPWIWKKIKRKNLKNKKVLCTIHHFEEKDFEKEGLKNFNKLDKYVDQYHVISELSFKQLKSLTLKNVTKYLFG